MENDSDRFLNYHHLRYFRAVARKGHLTRAARELRISQSALSAQIRQLEDQLGSPLFQRQGRSLVLNETGRIALAYADDIFSAGRELVTVVQSGRRVDDVLRVGAVATLSRNFQEAFIAPLLAKRGIRLSVESDRLESLLARLDRHDLDLVLSNEPIGPIGRAPSSGDSIPLDRALRESRDHRGLRCRRIARQPFSVIGHHQHQRSPLHPQRAARRRKFRFPRDLAGARLIVPKGNGDVRRQLEALCLQADVSVQVIAEVDDMAMMRLLTRDLRDAYGILPSIVVRDELKAGVLTEYCEVPDLFETFFSITIHRHYQHPLIRELLRRDEAEILEG